MDRTPCGRLRHTVRRLCGGKPFVNTGTHVVVGIDGSDTSLGAAKWAVTVAQKMSQPMQLVHSTPSPAHFSGDDLRNS
nr:universal stress protein [Rhodococcus sp. HNM0563]